MSEDKPTTDSRRRRSVKRPAGGAIAVRNERYREILNPLTPAEIFSSDQVEYIHQAALTLLEQRGLRVLSERARDCFAKAGAVVDSESGWSVWTQVWSHNRCPRLRVASAWWRSKKTSPSPSAAGGY